MSKSLQKFNQYADKNRENITKNTGKSQMNNRQIVNGYKNKALLDDSLYSIDNTLDNLFDIHKNLNDVSVMKKAVEVIKELQSVKEQLQEVRESYGK